MMGVMINMDKDKCIRDLYNLLLDVNNYAKRHDFSLLRIASAGGCDMYQGQPPIKRLIDEIYINNEEEICNAFGRNPIFSNTKGIDE